MSKVPSLIEITDGKVKRRSGAYDDGTAWTAASVNAWVIGQGPHGPTHTAVVVNLDAVSAPGEFPAGYYLLTEGSYYADGKNYNNLSISRRCGLISLAEAMGEFNKLLKGKTTPALASA